MNNHRGLFRGAATRNGAPMDDIGMTLHPVFGLAATGFVVLNLADPAWWHAGVGWLALAALLAVWGIHGIKRDGRR